MKAYRPVYIDRWHFTRLSLFCMNFKTVETGPAFVWKVVFQMWGTVLQITPPRLVYLNVWQLPAITLSTNCNTRCLLVEFNVGILVVRGPHDIQTKFNEILPFIKYLSFARQKKLRKIVCKDGWGCNRFKILSLGGLCIYSAKPWVLLLVPSIINATNNSRTRVIRPRNVNRSYYNKNESRELHVEVTCTNRDWLGGLLQSILFVLRSPRWKQKLKRWAVMHAATHKSQRTEQDLPFACLASLQR